MRMGKRAFSVELFVLKLSAHEDNLSVIPYVSKVIKGPLSEGETDITSKSDAKILNNVQKLFQVLYCVFCETYVHNSFRAGYLLWACRGDIVTSKWAVAYSSTTYTDDEMVTWQYVCTNIKVFAVQRCHTVIEPTTQFTDLIKRSCYTKLYKTCMLARIELANYV